MNLTNFFTDYAPIELGTCEICEENKANGTIGNLSGNAQECCEYCYKHVVKLRPLGYSYTRNIVARDIHEAFENFPGGVLDLEDIIKKYLDLYRYSNEQS